MTVQELAEKTYAGSMCHPICQPANLTPQVNIR